MTRTIEINGRTVLLDLEHNGFQWTAVHDDTYEPGCPIGLGDTQQEAIDDWLERSAEAA